MSKIINLKFAFSLIFFLVSFSLVTWENQRMTKKILGAQSQLEMSQQAINNWQEFLKKRPDYRDGWIQLAAAYYKIGDKQKAKEALLRAKALDSNNETILNFEKLLGD